MLAEQIRNNLSANARRPIADESLEKAAVVIAIVDEPSGEKTPCFLLTRRASTMRAHAGQFALPGGKLDKGENATQAALRELHEELGVVAREEDILGLLDDYPTRSGFCITPVIVWVADPTTITPNPAEVAKVFHIPLGDLANNDLLNLKPGESPDRTVLSINLDSIGHEIFAPTAAMIYQFYEVAIIGRESRVAHYDEPTFAWK